MKTYIVDQHDDNLVHDYIISEAEMDSLESTSYDDLLNDIISSNDIGEITSIHCHGNLTEDDLYMVEINEMVGWEWHNFFIHP